MVLTYYFIKYPYQIAWKVKKIFRRKHQTVLYCKSPLDAILFENVQKHLKIVKIVAKNSDIKKKLSEIGFKSVKWPVFPDVVIMFRNSAWRFPSKNVKKIGFEHGAYNFKRFSKSYYYNMFDVFFMTSQADVERVKKMGVKTAIAIGYPKIDSACNGSITVADLQRLSAKLKLDKTKKTVLFSSTWDGSGMSAIEKWYDRIDNLSNKYNILATVHSNMSDKYKLALRDNPNIHFIEDYEIIRYIMLSDVCIGDTNSLIAEFCLLDKPIITFRVPHTHRVLPDIIQIIEKISIRIDSIEEVSAAIEHSINNPDEFSEGRRGTTALMLDNVDGNAGLRAAEQILKYSPELKKF